MSDRKRTAPAPKKATPELEPIVDPLNWEEDEDYALRVRFGFRPIVYKADPDQHPDSRPCPQWCQCADGETVHSVDARMLTEAHHVSQSFETLLSYYDGSTCRTDDTTVVVASTLRSYLFRDGDGGRGTWIRLRADLQNPKPEQGAKMLTLSVDDAAELVTVLSALLAQADAANAAEGRS